MRTISSFLLAIALLMPAVADAQEWHHDRDHDHERWHGDPHWHGDIHNFHVHDYGYWRGGSWFHGPHGGRDGWWWIVGGTWYFYPAPVYPYPDPYLPPVLVTAQPAPVSPVGAAPSTVYYCGNPVGYYPYVPECLVSWQPVAAAPAAPAPVVAAPPPVAAPAPVLMPAPSASRETDDRRLNMLGAEYQRVNLAGPHARATLKKLEKKVAAFRQELYNRPYSVVDIIRDADALEHRIAEQRERLPAVVAPLPAQTMPQPAPVYPPPQ